MKRALSAMLTTIESRLVASVALVALLALPIGAAAQSTGARFDHLTTGFPLTGSHESAKCETCHVKGVFKGTPKTCEACHRPGNNLSSVVMPATHAPTTQRCELCHTTVSFVGARWNHVDAQPGGCVACHNGSTAPGKPAGHVATTQSCDVCHRTSAWVPAGFDHTGIVSGCSTCHNGVTAKGKPATHIPTSQPCESCHSSTASYTVWTMNHAQIVSGCATCHGGQYPDVMTKSASHIPTNAPCETCHATVTTFKGATFDHAGIASGCSNCHNGNTAVGMVAGHVPTNQPCEVCHSAANFTSFAGATMNHAGMSTGCATCHASGATFFGVSMKVPPANHIPFAGAACETCHLGSNFTSFGGTPMNHGAVAGMACATCHETGKSWFGVTIVTRPTPAQDPSHPTTGDCGACHTSTSSFNTGVGKPANHLPTNQPCTLCHSNPSNYAIGTMNHAGIASGCATCHAPGSSFANIVPVTPPPTHFPTPQPCETCHAAANFTSFAGTSMNHAGITSGCAICHATGASFFGVTMKTPPANHIPTSGAACEGCHSGSNFTSFAGTPMNHTPVAGIACATCHETGKSWFGVTIVTRPTPAQDPSHPATGDCGSCHASTTSFDTGVGKPANHLPTNQPCTLCHSNPSDYSVGTMNHAGITSGCAACHATGSSFANVVPKTPPANHIPTSKPCETCHAAANFTSFAGTAMNHAGITSGCATCHAAGASFFGVTVKTPPATHIPTGGAACEGCHAAANFTSFAGTAMSHTAVSGMACATCHESGKSWFGVTIVTRPTPAQDPNHPTTGDCGGCHTTSNFNTGVTKPANHLPTNQPCSLCHTNPNDYSVATMSHSGITSGCATCHASGSSFANVVPKAPPANHIPTAKSCETCHSASNFTSFAGTAMNHAGVTSGCATCHAAGSSFFGVTMKTPPATHIPFGGAACEACHAPANYTSFAGTGMNHNAVSGMKCQSCHEYGMSWYGVHIVTRPSPSHNPGQDCAGCHNTTSFDDGGGGGDAAVRLRAQRMRIGAPGIAAAATVAPRGARSRDVHVGIVPGSCLTCHNGATAPGKPPQHLITALSCDACHRTTTWRPATFTHAGAAPGTCATCHNAMQAKGKSAAHFITVRSCDTCHRTTSWAAPQYRHLSPAYRQHGAAVSCTACHKTNSEAVVWRAPAFKLDCAGCHADQFQPQQHPKPGGGVYTLVEMRDCAGTCHLGGQVRTPRTLAARHRPTDGGF